MTTSSWRPAVRSKRANNWTEWFMLVPVSLDHRCRANFEAVARREWVVEDDHIDTCLYHSMNDHQEDSRFPLEESEYLNRIIHTRSCVTWSSMTAWGSGVSPALVNTWTDRFTLVLPTLDRRRERRAEICPIYRLILERNDINLFLWYAVAVAGLWSMCALEESE